jgi:hypothetical protein
MSSPHDFTLTTLLGAFYPAMLLELKNPDNYPPGFKPKRYYDVRSIFEVSSPTTQCNNIIGKLKRNTECWICGAPIFLNLNGTSTFGDDSGDATIPDRDTIPDKSLKAECEHVLPVDAAWWVIGGLKSGNPDVETINEKLYKDEYRWSHHFCNHLKKDSIYFTPEGEPDIPVLEKTLSIIWLGLKPVRNYYEKKYRITTLEDFKQYQIRRMLAVLTPLISEYNKMLGEDSNLHLLALVANIKSHVERLAESQSIPQRLKNIIQKGISFQEEEPAELTAKPGEAARYEIRALEISDKDKLVSEKIQSLEKTKFSAGCSEDSILVEIINKIYDTKKSYRDADYLSFMYGILGFVPGESINKPAIRQKLCFMLKDYLIKIAPLLRVVINKMYPSKTLPQKESMFHERLDIALYYHLIQKINDSTSEDGSSSGVSDRINELLEYLTNKLNDYDFLVQERKKAAGSKGGRKKRKGKTMKKVKKGKKGKKGKNGKKTRRR